MQLLHFPVEYCFTIYNVLSASPLQLSCFAERALELAIPVEDINLFKNPYHCSSETTENSPFFLWKCLLVAVSPTAANLRTRPDHLSLAEGLECWVIPGKTCHQHPPRAEALWHKHLTGPGAAISRSGEPASVSSKHGVTGPRTSPKPGFSRPHAGPCHPFLDSEGEGRETRKNYSICFGGWQYFFFFLKQLWT